MIRRLSSPSALACVLTALVLAACALGPFMRETDQGWLLDGGMAIAKGHPEIARAEFNFDKQFVSYYLPGLLFEFLPRPFTADELVWAGNILGMALFWGAMFVLLARSAHRLSLALSLPVMLAPAFLVYSPFYASAFTSVSLVICLAAFLDRKKWNLPGHLLVFVLAFLAVGARADAIFILPLLAMLHSPRRSFQSVLRAPNTWLMAAGSLAAFLYGRARYLTDAVDYVPLNFHLKTYLGYIAFGLGGATLVLLGGLHAIWFVHRMNRCRLWLLFLSLGLVLPMAYYSAQLLSPRHCTVGAVSVLVFVCARRGRIIFHKYFRPGLRTTLMKAMLFLSALLPVFAGVDLSDLHHPKITFTRPTLLPSGAGVAPTGAYLAFGCTIRRDGGYLDHNQAVWAAAKTVHYEAASNGKVPYLFSPIESYLILSIHLQDKVPERHSLGNGPCPPRFYMESRSLMRFQFTFPTERVTAEQFLTTTAFSPATDMNWHGITMLLCNTNMPIAPDALNAPLWALNTAFGRDEFRLENISSLQQVPGNWAGHKMVLVSREPFTVANEPSLNSTQVTSVFGRWQISQLSPLRPGQKIPLQAVKPEAVYAGVSAFPEWMSLQKQ